MSDESQKYCDSERRLHDIRVENRERFATTLSDDLFAMGVENMKRFAGPPIQENDPSRLAAIAEEVASEGRIHRNTRPKRHE